MAETNAPLIISKDFIDMKKKLSFKEYLQVASMLFGLFFGAGNLIFPVHMGQMAGNRVIPAVLGFLLTGVSLPLLGVAALGVSRSNGLFELAGKVGKKYSYVFTCLLYLTIGPFFAIPRCATTSFTVGLEQILPGEHHTLFLFAFTLVFFAAALYFSLSPNRILTVVGKVLNPCFLVCLAIIAVAALLNPGAAVSEVAPQGDYVSQPFFTGFLEGYNTMDALASLAFGIIVVRTIRGLGVEKDSDVAAVTVRSGVYSCAFMAFIYVVITIVGTQSRGLFETSQNGGIALAEISTHYLGYAGLFVLAATVTLACLKTSVGLITSCSETFSAIFPKGPAYRVWVVIFSAASFLFANLGLDLIIAYSIPVLMFLYPLAITLPLMALFGKSFDNDRAVYVPVTALTLIAALYDMLRTLPDGVRAFLHVDPALGVIKEVLPLAKLGLGWICPAVAGLVIGIVIHLVKKRSTKKA